MPIGNTLGYSLRLSSHSVMEHTRDFGKVIREKKFFRCITGQQHRASQSHVQINNGVTAPRTDSNLSQEIHVDCHFGTGRRTVRKKAI